MNKDLDMAAARAQAAALDAADPLAGLRAEFLIPTKAQMAAGEGAPVPAQRERDTHRDPTDAPVTYLVGNSLGLQPRRTWDRIRHHLETWATWGVTGHFSTLSSSADTDTPPTSSPPWVDVDAYAARMMAPLVGAASPAEVAVMQTLSANLHLLLCAFYRPDAAGRHEILLEEKAFPSDHFIVESQIRHHSLSPSTSLVAIAPSPTSRLLSTDTILATLSAHASTASILLLPGIQYYTGQLLNIPCITAHAHSLGVVVLWDLAHAAGNVPLELHAWGVDAAAWCGYKYLNGGPGCIGSLFLHEKHHGMFSTTTTDGDTGLKGWWGTEKKSRFEMDTSRFVPGRGAAALQLSNPSVLCTTALCASLEVFRQAGGMVPLRAKSEKLTSFLYSLLESLRERTRTQTQGQEEDKRGGGEPLFDIITPREADRRGAQLSILLLRAGVLDDVVRALGARGVYVDERRPDVIRVAPAPLYNSFGDCCNFVDAFGEALGVAM